MDNYKNIMVKLNWFEKVTIYLVFIGLAITTNPYEITQYTILWRYTLIEIVRVIFGAVIANIVVKLIENRK